MATAADFSNMLNQQPAKKLDKKKKPAVDSPWIHMAKKGSGC